MYLSKAQNVFVQSAKCICPISRKLRLRNVFGGFLAKYLFPPSALVCLKLNFSKFRPNLPARKALNKNGSNLPDKISPIIFTPTCQLFHMDISRGRIKCGNWLECAWTFNNNSCYISKTVSQLFWLVSASVCQKILITALALWCTHVLRNAVVLRPKNLSKAQKARRMGRGG